MEPRSRPGRTVTADQTAGEHDAHRIEGHSVAAAVDCARRRDAIFKISVRACRTRYPRFIIEHARSPLVLLLRFNVNDRNLRLSIGKYIPLGNCHLLGAISPREKCS